VNGGRGFSERKISLPAKRTAIYGSEPRLLAIIPLSVSERNREKRERDHSHNNTLKQVFFKKTFIDGSR
jgi:hypothetical protein